MMRSRRAAAFFLSSVAGGAPLAGGLPARFQAPSSASSPALTPTPVWSTPPVPGPAAREREAAEVWITTDPAVTAGCVAVPPTITFAISGGEGLDAVRREAMRRGANLVRLLSLTDRKISGDPFRCGDAAAPPARTISSPAAAPAPEAPTAVAPLPSPFATPRPTIAPEPRAPRERAKASRGARSGAGSGITSDERRKQAREELDELKAAIPVVEDPGLIDGCEKRGAAQASAEGGEDELRGNAVGALANVLLIHRGANGLSGEYFRCPRQQLQRLQQLPQPSPTPTPGR